MGMLLRYFGANELSYASATLKPGAMSPRGAAARLLGRLGARGHFRPLPGADIGLSQ